MLKPESKFLVVDDFAAMRRVVKNVLIGMGFTNFVEASDGQSAYELIVAAATTPDPVQFVISDWNMPKMHGIDLLIKCRADLATKTLPIVLVTAENEQKHISRALEAGVSEYVIKPFSQQTLREKIERVIARTNKAAVPTGEAV